MSLTGKQSPLGVNVQSSLLNNQGLNINSVVSTYLGSSKTNADYTFGKLVQDTVLRMQTLGINDAYLRNLLTRTNSIDTYDNLINIGATTVPALGNSKPPTYEVSDPSGVWTTNAENYADQKGVSPALPGPANSGYALTSNEDEGQQATWFPYTGVSTDNPNTSISQWGYLRLHALQAWNEFNWNGADVDWSNPEYKEFLSSFLTAQSFVSYSNQAIIAMNNSKTFLEGTYSNMNDLISADISGVSLSSQVWGNDLINLGTAITLSEIDVFGLPSSLLRTLTRYGALTEELALMLLASGFTSTELTQIINQEITPTVKQEQQIYGSFLVIVGDNLRNILALLKCRTTGIETLADLLRVRKLFPNSYQTLTVPMYNTAGGPANSKIYYLIFNNGGLNSSLTLFDVPNSYSPGNDLSVPVEESQNIKVPDNTLGSYLFNIVSKEDAISAGAFAYSMMQIRNIKQCDFETFAQIVRSNETIAGLNLVNGTNKPTDETLVNQALGLTALGSGVYGSYTMSDMFGSMSGLPYQWEQIYSTIKQLETTKLYNIYKENFLAITWEGAAVTVQYTDSGIGPTPYTVTGITLTNPGGGYGRGSAPAPTITIAGGSGATATCTIGTDDTDAGSDGTGTFGRVTSVTLTSAGSPSATIPTITIQYPPTATLAVQANGSVATGGTNTASGTVGWPATMNAVVQAYIDQANTEITSIKNNNPTLSEILNTYWNICGTQLKREQRARYIAMPPVPVIAPDSSSVVRKDYFLNPYPSTLYTFTDSIPSLGQDTKPHMSAQTLEAISDLNTLGGQSIVALMRESRNRNRLLEAGIPLDNNIPDQLSDLQVKQLTTNGTLPNDPNGIQGECNTFTQPAWPSNIDPVTKKIISPVPAGVFTDGSFNNVTGTTTGDIIPILTQCGDVSVNTLVPTGPEIITPLNEPYIISVPIQVNPAIPIQLDTQYTNSTLLPASPSIQEAIDKVIECNCDCWIN